MSADNTIILGGGLAGLATSVYTGAPVYEASDQAGGVAASDTAQGFTFDYGIHVLHTRNQVVLDMLRELGVMMQQHSRRAYIYSHTIYTAYPFQVNTAGLPIGLRARCIWNFLNRSKEAEPTNYEEWMYRNLGRGFADTFLIPYSEKFWGVSPKEMTFEWTGDRVPKPGLWQVLRGALQSKQTQIGTNVDFRYPLTEVGYGAIAEALKNKCGTLHLRHRAVEIDPRKKRVSFDNGACVRYDTLVNTIPLPELIKLCPAAPEHVRTAAAQLRTNSIMVVNLGIDRPAISSNHWVHFPEKDISFFRMSYPHNFADNVTPADMSSISAEVAYHRNNPPDPAELTERVIQDLIRVKALPADAPVVLKMTRDIPFAYCIYDKQRKAALNTVHDWLTGMDIMPAGRYGLWAYFWSDDAMLSGKRTAEKLLLRNKAVT
jgi:protoporphyrinogen oxidase